MQSHMFKQRLAESVMPFTYHYAIWRRRHSFQLS
ncbi:hypothetical protein LTSESEN_4571, partial [Salmonella enterica subsp. enterica serovar Senftenberg str. A4-543]